VIYSTYESTGPAVPFRGSVAFIRSAKALARHVGSGGIRAGVNCFLIIGHGLCALGQDVSAFSCRQERADFELWPNIFYRCNLLIGVCRFRVVALTTERLT